MCSSSEAHKDSALPSPGRKTQLKYSTRITKVERASGEDGDDKSQAKSD